MAETTEYDKLLSDERKVLNSIAERKEEYKKELAELRTELRRIRKALLRYDNLTVVHVRNDNNEKPDWKEIGFKQKDRLDFKQNNLKVRIS